MSQITSHVLDTAEGRPAAGIPVRLLTASGDLVAEGVTDEDGRVRELGPDAVESGDYRLEFDVATPFLPRVVIEFTVSDASHHHVPVLLSPYGYTTYRGS